jgi:hypothetical protein
MTTPLKAGAAAVSITPTTSQFLHGYPHVKRYSTGVHDPLYSSALFLNDGAQSLLIVANDILYIPKDLAARARRRIAQTTGAPAESIMITATHTHSAPVVVRGLGERSDPVVPEPDPAYLEHLEDGIVASAERAFGSARPAEIGLAVAHIDGVGTNRRAPDGPADPEAPVLMVRDPASHAPIAAMVVYAMHPTVLHEDSALVSADFPGMARRYLQEKVLKSDCPVLHHMGAAGNQSPRYCVRGQTFAEAERLGELFGQAVGRAIPGIAYRRDIALRAGQDFLNFPLRQLPSANDAEQKVKAVRAKLARQQSDGTPRAVVRTTECDLFGAEETLCLSRAAADGLVAAALARCMPAEVQLFRIGPWTFVGWQGEVFVEYALQVRRQCPDAFILTCANGSLQGYIVTEEAAAEGGYEASNALFAPSSGAMLVERTLQLMRSLP